MTPSDLETDLELAMMALLDGDPPGALFASRVKREVEDVLRRRGVNGTVCTTEGGQRVQITVPEGDRVRHIALDLTRLH